MPWTFLSVSGTVEPLLSLVADFGCILVMGKCLENRFRGFRRRHMNGITIFCIPNLKTPLFQKRIFFSFPFDSWGLAGSWIIIHFPSGYSQSICTFVISSRLHNATNRKQTFDKGRPPFRKKKLKLDACQPKA
jgi:hypothetical protein